MPVSIVLLVLGSALAHASWNAILKRCREPEHAVIGMMFLAAASGVLFAVVLRAPAPPLASLAWCVASGVLEACYFVTLARALSRAPLGSVYTVVRGGALVVVWPISVLALGEAITAARAIGTLLVVLGLVATGAAPHRPAPGAFAASAAAPPREGAGAPNDGLPSEGAEAPRAGRPPAPLRSGIAVAALCALFVGGYHLAYKLALSTGGEPAAVVAIALSTASLLNVTALGARRAAAFATARSQPARLVVGGLLASFGFLVLLAAMKDAGAGVILTLRNTSILFAQVLAVALGERPRRLGVLGAVLVTAGAVLLAH
ncbi:MAG: EamA family transporter [Labilithrix sp.]|nr:EamA family transporter [Labilithrix sp.]